VFKGALFLVLASLPGCRGRSGEPSAPLPRLELLPECLDLGRLVQDEEAQGSVLITNTGAVAWQLGAVSQSRFCSGSMTPTLLLPGQTAQLAVRCHSDLHGPLREGIDIRATDARLPPVTVPIRGEVTALLAFDAPQVEQAMPFGEERATEVHLVGTLADQARPRQVGAAAPDSEIVALPYAAGKPRGYRLRCLGHKVGANAGNLVVATGLPRPGEIAIPYVCRVSGTLEVTPSNPFFNLKISGDKAVRLVVRSSQPGFAVHAVRVTQGPFAARFEHAEDDNTYRIDVSVASDRIADEARTATGTLLIESNDRSEPHKEVPLFGSGRINKVPAP
jgi:hypothetical protein